MVLELRRAKEGCGPGRYLAVYSSVDRTGRYADPGQYTLSRLDAEAYIHRIRKGSSPARAAHPLLPSPLVSD